MKHIKTKILISTILLFILGSIYFKSPLSSNTTMVSPQALTKLDAQFSRPIKNSKGEYNNPKMAQMKNDLNLELSKRGFTVTEKNGDYVIQKTSDISNTEEKNQELKNKIESDLRNELLEMARSKGFKIADESELTEQDQKMLALFKDQIAKR